MDSYQARCFCKYCIYIFNFSESVCTLWVIIYNYITISITIIYIYLGYYMNLHVYYQPIVSDHCWYMWYSWFYFTFSELHMSFCEYNTDGDLNKCVSKFS